MGHLCDDTHVNRIAGEKSNLLFKCALEVWPRLRYTERVTIRVSWESSCAAQTHTLAISLSRSSAYAGVIRG